MKQSHNVNFIIRIWYEINKLPCRKKEIFQYVEVVKMILKDIQSGALGNFYYLYLLEFYLTEEMS